MRDLDLLNAACEAGMNPERAVRYVHHVRLLTLASLGAAPLHTERPHR